jgi:hypothetical protein
VAALREVGREWAESTPERMLWQRALPIDPSLTFAADEEDRHGRFVPIRSGRAGQAPALEATPRAGAPDSLPGRALSLARRALVGPPLRSTAVAEERMRKALALPVLSPDALSSVAYGPERCSRSSPSRAPRASGRRFRSAPRSSR